MDGSDVCPIWASNTCINLCAAEGSCKKFSLAPARTVCTTLFAARMSAKNKM